MEKTVMIIDDDPTLLDTLEDALTSSGLRIFKHDSTTGAVAAMLEHRPALLILDVMFPEDPAGGFDLAREIRKNPELAELPIILLTGINQELPGDLSREDMGDDWFPVQELLEKPVDLDLLRSRVNDLLKAGGK